MLDQTASASANRRVFRSKVDDLRPTYGFDDVSLAPGTDTIEPADVVTLDRMVCCYSDMPRLIGVSVAHAQRMVGLVYPRDAWWTRGIARVMNALGRLTRGQLRWYIHPEQAIDGRIRRAGFERRFLRRYLLWQVALYVRSQP